MQICHGVLFGQTMDDYWLTICFIDDNCLGVNGIDEFFWKRRKLWNSGNFGNLGNFGKMWNFVADKGCIVPTNT